MEPDSPYATSDHSARPAVVTDRAGMALAVEAAFWAAAGRYHHRTGELQLLLPVDDRSAGVGTAVAAAVVVVTKVSTGNTALYSERIT